MIRIGVLCPSEIALRRFMPALQQIKEACFVGVGCCRADELFGAEQLEQSKLQLILSQERAKAEVFTEQYGGKVFDGYAKVVASEEIDAVYIPLPPALHYDWAKKALENGKHVLVEKPSTLSAAETKELADVAEVGGVALHENYMFAFHDQLTAIENIVKSGELGEVRLYRISFGFPRRSASDFRYNRALGGGALIDAGGYTLKYAARLLGETAQIRYAQMNYTDGFEVDIYGSAALVNGDGVTAQIAFGMDNQYKCELEIWGSKGTLTTGRVLTAPAGFVPTATVKCGDESRTAELPADDTFQKSIRHFLSCISDEKLRRETYGSICRQAELVDSFRAAAAKGGSAL